MAESQKINILTTLQTEATTAKISDEPIYDSERKRNPRKVLRRDEHRFYLSEEFQFYRINESLNGYGRISKEEQTKGREIIKEIIKDY